MKITIGMFTSIVALSILFTRTSSAIQHQDRVQYEANWESLDKRATPQWWIDQKFSLFMHWGLYAVPAYCPVTPTEHTCYAEHFWDTSHVNGSAQNE